MAGESAADLGGLTIAYDAYHRALHGRADSPVGSLSGDQRFFIAFARRWRTIGTDAAVRAQIASDTHAPPACRANLVRNLEPWAAVFGVHPPRPALSRSGGACCDMVIRLRIRLPACVSAVQLAIAAALREFGRVERTLFYPAVVQGCVLAPPRYHTYRGTITTSEYRAE